MKFVGVIERETTITVDGYSNRKTLKAALKDMGRYIRDHLNEGEGQCILNYPEEVRVSWEAKKQGCYFLEAEEVPCACRWHEDTEEMEYADGNWYIVCRFVK
jgi:hypothetical protein